MPGTSPETVVAIVAHPDDEVLGAGGTLARHAEEGDAVHAIFLTDGVGARGSDRVAAEARAKAARSAADILGIGNLEFLKFPDQRLDEIPLLDVVQKIEALLQKMRPSTIYTNHFGDLNADHQICHKAVMTACRPIPGSPVKKIYLFEVASSTEWQTITAGAFAPAKFVNIETTAEKKRKALQAYAEEMRAFPHARSLEALDALARWRGASVGFKAAEAFMVVRDLKQ
jgi:LmbE family N-acetylglucosaminyl deacetylase